MKSERLPRNLGKPMRRLASLALICAAFSSRTPAQTLDQQEKLNQIEKALEQ
jgi:hypothetical protein